MSTLAQVVNFIFSAASPLSGVSHAGTINIESGNAEVRSEYFEFCSGCDDQMSVVKVCSACGRQPGNNVGFRAGRGDGVYSGLSLMAGNSLLGSIFVFDENNQHAMNLAAELSRCENAQSLRDNRFQELLFEALATYADTDAYDAGNLEVKNSEFHQKCFLISDATASVNSDFASVDHPFGNEDYRVILFAEPLSTLSATDETFIQMGGTVEELTGGTDGALRPRVLLVINAEFFGSLGAKAITAKSHDWSTSVSAWKSSLVVANLLGGNNLNAIYYNGVFWSLAARDQPADSEINSAIWYLYATRAFGWFVQGALLGDDDSTNRMVHQINDAPDADILDIEVLQDALDARGWDASAEILEKVTQIWQRSLT